MFPNGQDIYNQVEAKHTVSTVEDLRNNAVKSTVLYKNYAKSNLLQLKLFKLILFSSFIRHKQHFCTWNVLWVSSIHHPSPLEHKVELYYPGANILYKSFT